MFASMLRCASKEFGVVEYEAAAVISFPRGLPGFETERFFVPIEREATKPVLFLQSLVTPALCFTTLPVESIAPDYRMKLSAEDFSTIGMQAGATTTLRCLVLVCAGKNQPPTANLLGPLVINPENGKAVQAIRDDSEYSVRHPLWSGQGVSECL
jgi:flagellar assembly factor FliW